MARRAEASVVNAAGLVQGIALVTFPAAGTICTDPADCDLLHPRPSVGGPAVGTSVTQGAVT